ncbi:MAG: IPT/TIG domain-containing protein [Deltaproteobacteria bacterium]|nr:IPT/TIG domain-containing protein [Deltaproteobacteria bacterium]
MKFAALLLVGCASSNGPHLTSVTPSQAPYGSTVTIAGERLCEGDCMTAGGEITFGDARATILSLTDTAASVSVPDGAVIGKTTIVLTVNNTSSNALAFTVVAP